MFARVCVHCSCSPFMRPKFALLCGFKFTVNNTISRAACSSMLKEMKSVLFNERSGFPFSKSCMEMQQERFKEIRCFAIEKLHHGGS